MPQPLYRSLFSDYVLQPAETIIIGPGVNELTVQRVLKAAISVNDKTVNKMFYVVDGTKQTLLSHNASEKFYLLKKCLK